MTDLNLKEKLEEWFSKLPVFRNSTIKRINIINKNKLDEIHKEFIEKGIENLEKVSKGFLSPRIALKRLKEDAGEFKWKY